MSQKKPNYAFFRDREKYLFATGESPKLAKGVLAVVWEGTPDNLTEAVKPVKQLHALEHIEPAAVPLEWWNGFAKATGCLTKREPPPEPIEPPESTEPPEPTEPLAEIVIVALIIATGLGLLIWS